MNKKQLFSVIVGLLSVLAFPVSGHLASKATPNPAASPVPEGKIRLAVTYLGREALDPMLADSSSNNFLQLLYDSLVGTTSDGNFSKERGLADSWKMSPDGMTWTFQLKKGIKFHNGDEVTAEDVKFSLARYISEKSTSGRSSFLKAAILRMVVPDPYTLVIHCKKPSPFLIASLSQKEVGSEWSVVPKKYIEEVGDEEFNIHPIGSGPYKFKEQVIGSHLLFEATDKHWLVGVPKYKEILLQLIPEETTRIAMLKAGETDIIEVSAERIAALKQAGFGTRVREAGMLINLTFQLRGQGIEEMPLYKKEVRQALNLGINKEEILQTIFKGLGKVPPHPYISAQSFGYLDIPPHPYDPEKAKQLLTNAGYPDGIDIDIYSYTRSGVPEAPRMLEAIAGYWSKIGVRAKLIATDYASVRDKLWKTHKIPGQITYMSTGGLFKVASLKVMWHTNGFLSSLADPELDRLIENVEGQLILEEAEKAFRKVLQYMYDYHLSGPIVEIYTTLVVDESKTPDWNLGMSLYAYNLIDLITRK
jgi:peptide/nickel transport system substrate-binding protein